MGAPADAAARRLEHVTEEVEPLVGWPLGKVVWWLLGLAGAGVLARGLWPGAR
jgi:hypothetical protein